MEKEDISKDVLISLMFLAVVITFIGTLLIFSSLEEMKGVKSYEDQNTVGKVGINILQGEPAPSVSGGMVGINIVNEENQNS